MDVHKIMDAHIHLDQYLDEELPDFMKRLKDANCKSLVVVGSNLQSCKRVLELSKRYEEVTPAFGFHPEQKLPRIADINELFSWIEHHAKDVCAIGEIGLPTYMRREQPDLDMSPYIEILIRFLELVVKWDKPAALHAVYDEADIVCDLLEARGIEKAHFHWFKGSMSTMKRMANRGYMISLTPEVVYREKIQKIATYYPLELMMAETDGPWPFSAQFVGRRTHPEMIHESIEAIASLKQLNVAYVYEQIYENTKAFYEMT